MITLRPYQDRALNEIRAHFRGGLNAVLFQLPTGGGKTLTAASMLRGAAEKGNIGWFIVNRVELVEQTVAAFQKLNVHAGIIAAGFTPTPRAPVQVVSIQTVARRLDSIKYRPRLAVWDECRGIAAAGATRVFRELTESKHVGLDATPERLDGKGLDAYFQEMVCGPTYSELMDLGNLVPFDCYAPHVPDLRKVKTKMGDYDQKEVETLLDQPKLVGDVVSHYVTHARGKQGLTFAISVEHSQHLAAAYRASGVNAMHLDGGSDRTERKRIVEAYRRGEIEQLCNVDLFTAGFDVPGVEVISMGRPTQSLPVFLQQAGRGSRPEGGKKACMLFDHVGNVLRHGPPDMDREWSLEGRKKKKKKDSEPSIAMRRCEECFYVYSPPVPTCPLCGHVHQVVGRAIEEVGGDLKKLSAEEKAAIAARNKKELKQARTLEDLRRIEQERGYKPGWAEQTWRSRKEAHERYSQTRVESQFAAYRR